MTRAQWRDPKFRAAYDLKRNNARRKAGVPARNQTPADRGIVYFRKGRSKNYTNFYSFNGR